MITSTFFSRRTLLFGERCHRNAESVASNLELLINLSLPHVTEQIAAGLSDASRRREHRLSWLCEDGNNISYSELTGTHTGTRKSSKNKVSNKNSTLIRKEDLWLCS